MVIYILFSWAAVMSPFVLYKSIMHRNFLIEKFACGQIYRNVIYYLSM